MIVKDEEKVILRCLNSVLPIIDSYIIVDTGSTDNTKSLIKNFFDEKGIEGEILDYEFTNFSDSRNFAINSSINKTDFCFTIDADEILSFESSKEEVKSFLEDTDSAIINVSYNGTVYGRKSFFKPEKFKYIGAVHEVLIPTQENTTEKNILGITTIVNSDGNSWSIGEKEKYLNHVKIFLQDIDKNGLEPRNVFYLAQSYRDSRDYENALLWYQKRLTLENGFYEELYFSQLMVGYMKWYLGKPIWEVAHEFMACSEYDPLRCEHFTNLKLFYEKNNFPNSAKQIEKILLTYKGKNPYPNRLLFINEDSYKMEG